MFKRVGAIVVTIAMLLSMACTFSLASAADNMALEVLVEDNVQAVKPGDKVTIEVNVVNQTAALCGITVLGKYDTAKWDIEAADISAIDLSPLTYVPVLDKSAEAEANINAVWLGAEEILPAEGYNLLRLTFTAKEEAELGASTFSFWFKEDGMVNVANNFTAFSTEAVTADVAVENVEKVTLSASVVGDPAYVKAGETVTVQVKVNNYASDWAGMTIEGSYDKNLVALSAEDVSAIGLGTNAPVLVLDEGRVAVSWINAENMAGDAEFVALTLTFTALEDISGNAIFNFSFKDGGVVSIGADNSYITLVAGTNYVKDAPALNVEVKDVIPMYPTVTAQADAVKQGETVNFVVSAGDYAGNLWGISFEGTFDAAKFTAEIEPVAVDGVTATPVVDNVNGTYAVAFISTDVIARAPGFIVKLTAKDDAALGDAALTAKFKTDGMIGVNYAPAPAEDYVATPVEDTVEIQSGFVPMAPGFASGADVVKQGDTVEFGITAENYLGNLWGITYEGTFDAAKFEAEILANPAEGVTAIPVVDNTNGTYAVVFISSAAIAEAPSFTLKLTAKADAALGDATVTVGFKADGMIGENYVAMPETDFSDVDVDTTINVELGVQILTPNASTTASDVKQGETVDVEIGALKYEGNLWGIAYEGTFDAAKFSAEVAVTPAEGVTAVPVVDNTNGTYAVVFISANAIAEAPSFTLKLTAKADATLGDTTVTAGFRADGMIGENYVQLPAADYTATAPDVTIEVTEGIPAGCDHDYTGEWKHSDEGHWKECDYCGEPNQVLPHSGEDDGDCTTAVVCECGYVITPANPEHTLGDWQSDDEGHWKECANCDYATDKVGHSGEDDGDCTTAVFCECGREIIPANPEHTLGDWQSDDEGHWKECANCDYATDKVGHSGEDDGDCTTAVICECGHEITPANPEHTGDGIWQWNEDDHWQKCVNCNCSTEEAEHTHVADPFDCTMLWACECGHMIEGNLDHDFENGEWEYDGFGHWKVCADCAMTSDKYEHVEPEDDFDCTTALACECGYVYTPANDAHDFSAMPEHDGEEGANAGHYYYCSRGNCWEAEYEPCSFTATVVPETCIEDGYTAYRCTKCHYGYTDHFVPAHGNHTGIVLQYKAPSSDANGAQGIVVKYCTGGNHVLEEIKDIPAGHPFPDVQNPNEWYYDAAVFCKAFNIMKGDENGNMNFANPITRGELVTALGRIIAPDVETKMSAAEFDAYLAAQGSKVTGMASGGTNLSDIGGTFYERYAKLFAKWGIVTGYEDGSFRGNNNITREEMATLLYRFTEAYCGTTNVSFGAPAAGFSDASTISGWAVPYANWAGQVGLFRGDENGNFNPKNNASRAEIAMVCYRMLPVLMNIEII